MRRFAALPLMSIAVALDLRSVVPTPSGALMLPGETRRFALDAPLSQLPRILQRDQRPAAEQTMRDVLEESTLCGQLLTTPHGNVLLEVPILLVTDADHGGTAPSAELTCIGHGLLNVPPPEHGGVGAASIDAVVAEGGGSPSAHAAERCFGLQARHEHCRAIAAKHTTTVPSGAGALLGAEPLVIAINQRTRALQRALGCLEPSAGGEWRAMIGDSNRYHQLVTYALTGLLPAESRLDALASFERRLRYADVMLRDVERQLGLAAHGVAAQE